MTADPINPGSWIDMRDVQDMVDTINGESNDMDYPDEIDRTYTDADIDRVNRFCAAVERETGYSVDSLAWEGETAIPETDWIEYVKDFATDIGAVAPDATWPNRHIDWDAAARDLAQDYTTFDWEGHAYYVRASL